LTQIKAKTIIPCRPLETRDFARSLQDILYGQIKFGLVFVWSKYWWIDWLFTE